MLFPKNKVLPYILPLTIFAYIYPFANSRYFSCTRILFIITILDFQIYYYCLVFNSFEFIMLHSLFFESCAEIYVGLYSA